MKTKQKILLGLAGLTALAVAGGSVGTMAWFYSNTTVTASGLSMSVTSPDTLEISDDLGSTWSTSLTFSVDVALSPCCVLPVHDDDTMWFANPTDSGTMTWASCGCDGFDVYIPAASNGVSANGSLATSWGTSTWSNTTAFTKVGRHLSSPTIDSSLQGYIFIKVFRIKHSKASNNANLALTLTPTYTYDNTKDIFKAFRFAAETNTGYFLDTNPATADVATLTGVMNETGIIRVAFWYDGNLPYCITSNAVTAKMSVSLSFQIAAS